MPRSALREFTLPASCASALINHDLSSLEYDAPEEAAACRRFLADLAAEKIRIEAVAPDFEGEPMDPYFTWDLSVAGLPTRGGMVLDFLGIQAA